MFQIIILVASSLALTAAVQFTDCTTDKSNAIVTVQQLDFSPSPLIFPGDVHFTLNLTAYQPINYLFVDVVLEKKLLGIWTKVPCIRNIGTCNNIDFCPILPTILNGSSLISKELGQQIDTMLESALGHKLRCPIQPETLDIKDYTLSLQAVSSTLSWFSHGDYRIQISVKDDPTTTDNLGCIKFLAKIGVPTPGVG
ncbi:ganglioside GM2 activator-like [Mercenaria mercenaria]|uniref:ganglioside GM2 activator-like n=1 Tax=Mercenaria mercenaria TaxID=6596 RepID=UPI00234F3EB8|nr:ganglioside GM2 activator-like [Mercenaria mercenaria]